MPGCLTSAIKTDSPNSSTRRASNLPSSPAASRREACFTIPSGRLSNAFSTVGIFGEFLVARSTSGPCALVSLMSDDSASSPPSRSVRSASSRNAASPPSPAISSVSSRPLVFPSHLPIASEISCIGLRTSPPWLKARLVLPIIMMNARDSTNTAR